MKPRITVITLGVDDLEKSIAFYREGLGLPTKGIVGTEFEHGRSPSLIFRAKITCKGPRIAEATAGIANGPGRAASVLRTS